MVSVYFFGVHGHGILPSFSPDIGFFSEVLGYDRSHFQRGYYVLRHEIIRIFGEYDYILLFGIGKRAVSISKKSCEFVY